MDENKIISYIEPIFKFCCKRLNNRYDAEDLASEIICYVLEGIKKYKIDSLDAWVWRVAHNRYAKFIDTRNKTQMVLAEDTKLLDILDGYDCNMNEDSTEQEFEMVFRYLHTLSSEYRNIFIDHYIGEMSIRMLSEKYSIPETTIKWRLNVGRKKIRERIGENSMDKLYKRINWNTTCCNGCMDANQYLHSQMARAICQAAYEKPLTVEELSIRTGIPTIYIEDELPRLEYGDAICKIGNKYVTNFIIFQLKDRKDTESISVSLVKEIADKFDSLLQNGAKYVKNLDFYGHDFGMHRLGYIVIPYILRRKIGTLKNKRLKLENGLYPMRKDGGYGWFIVEETMDENENFAEYNTGCNIAGGESGNRNTMLSYVYYYWVSKYFDKDIYCNGTRWLCENEIPNIHGIIEKGTLCDEDIVRLIQHNLVIKSGDDYKLNFACFTEKQFVQFLSFFDIEDENLDNLLVEWISTVRKNFVKFVPARLESQINQWVSLYVFQMIGYVVEELIDRGTLEQPNIDKPLTNGVFYVEGKYIEP